VVLSEPGPPVGAIIGWSIYGSFAAMVEPQEGVEVGVQGPLPQRQDIKVTLRWSPLTSKITTKMRVWWNRFPYDVRSVQDIGGRHREIVLIARETTP
jgi:hypothetical protein